MKRLNDSKSSHMWYRSTAPRYGMAFRKSSVLILASSDANYIAMMKPVLTRAGFNVKVASSERDVCCLTFCISTSVILVDQGIGSGIGAEIVKRLKNQPHIGKTPIYMVRSESVSISSENLAAESALSEAKSQP